MSKLVHHPYGLVHTSSTHGRLGMFQLHPTASKNSHYYIHSNLCTCIQILPTAFTYILPNTQTRPKISCCNTSHSYIYVRHFQNTFKSFHLYLSIPYKHSQLPTNCPTNHSREVPNANKYPFTSKYFSLKNSKNLQKLQKAPKLPCVCIRAAAGVSILFVHF